MPVDLAGSWTLVAWRRVSEDGTVVHPLGEDARGVLVYTPEGRMAVTLTAAQRPELPEGDPLGGDVQSRADAYSTCLAYVGTWELRGEEVVHRIDVSLYPGWTGAEQVRPYTWDGEELVLRTPPAQGPHGRTVNELAWRRESRQG